MYFVGATFNFIAMKSNGFRMPYQSDVDFITPDYYFRYENSSDINMSFFVDRIHYKYKIVSVGDLLIWISLYLLLIYFLVMFIMGYIGIWKKYFDKNNRRSG